MEGVEEIYDVQALSHRHPVLMDMQHGTTFEIFHIPKDNTALRN
jgi:hypothetical protein